MNHPNSAKSGHACIELPKENEEMHKCSKKKFLLTQEEKVKANTLKADSIETVNRYTRAYKGAEISVRNYAADCHLFR